MGKKKTVKRTPATKAKAQVAKRAAAAKDKAISAKKTTAAKKTPKELKRAKIEPMKLGHCRLRLIGANPLLVNSIQSKSKELADEYGSEKGKTSVPKKDKANHDEAYAAAFYTLSTSKYPAPHPKGLYGVPASAIEKCFCAAIRLTGVTDNTTVGTIQKSFSVIPDDPKNNLVLIQSKNGFHRDIRTAPNGSGGRGTGWGWRHRPEWDEWWMDVTFEFNPKTMSPEQILNLGMYAGQWIGLCEMRKERKQGSRGKFVMGK
jgi:hypothetical protein